MNAFPKDLIVSVSGIRGRVGLELTPEIVTRFSSAFGSFVQSRGWGERVALARDSRPSGTALADAAAAGLTAVGCHVVDYGLVPTPTALLAIEEQGLSGGIVITASHNPREWNALKLASPRGAFLTSAEGAELLAGLDGGTPTYAGWDGYGERRAAEGVIERHVERIFALDLIDPAKIAARRIKVAVDATRGAGGVILPGMLERLGCRVVPIELEPDGLFTREPEPVPENLGVLAAAVTRERCELGMAVDPDADRLALVDASGRPIGEDFTLALVVQLVLANRSGPVVANLSTSQVVAEACARSGAPFHRAPVGEANVAEMMREVGAVVGGEGNGGVILPTLHYTRDAPLAMALILQLLADTQLKLADIVASYPQFRIVKDRVPRSELELGALAAEIEAVFPGADVDRRDGLHLSWPEQRLWLHVRPSGTEPVVRLIAEGPAAEEEVVARLIEVGRGAIAAGE